MFELISVVVSAGKKVLVVIDPSSPITYEFSMLFVHILSKDLNDWKTTLEEPNLPMIKIWYMTAEQMEAGNNMSIKTKCFEVQVEEKAQWLMKSDLTEDLKRISKHPTIRIFNRMIDEVSNTKPPSPACPECGGQQASSYIDKCSEGDKGAYQGCEVCGKDQHATSGCRLLNFKVKH